MMKRVDVFGIYDSEEPLWQLEESTSKPFDSEVEKDYPNPVNTSPQASIHDQEHADQADSADYFEDSSQYQEESEFKNALETVHEEIEVTDYSVQTEVNPRHEADSMGLKGLTDRSFTKEGETSSLNHLNMLRENKNSVRERGQRELQSLDHEDDVQSTPEQSVLTLQSPEDYQRFQKIPQDQ